MLTALQTFETSTDNRQVTQYNIPVLLVGDAVSSSSLSAVRTSDITVILSAVDTLQPSNLRQ